MSNITMNNWQPISLDSISNSIDQNFTDIDALLNGITSANLFIVDNTTASGSIQGPSSLFNVDIHGNHFTDISSIVNFYTFEFSNASTTIHFDTNLNYNVNTDAISGYISKVTYDTISGNHLELTGKLNLNAAGDITGGSVTHVGLISGGNTIDLYGNVTLNTFGDITAGSITSFAITDNSGHSLAISNISISFAKLDALTDPLQGHAGLDDLYNFLTTGNDTISSNNVADTLRGGKGNDTYIVDNAGDVVTELFNEGVDLVKASIDYTLTDNVENLTLTDGSVNGGTVALNGTGNALNNIITGNAGSNILDGGAGVDTLKGGADNDRYIVDLIQTGTAAASFRVALQDTVTEALNAGEDTLELRGNFDHLNATTLSLGLNLENLDASATGTTKLNLTGNTLNNILTGNDAGNILDGATGSDTLIGGLGNDTYMLDLKISGTGVSANVNTFDDTVTEINGTTDGIDTIKLRGAATLTNASTLILDGQWANIENLDASATGTTKLNLTGNDADNFLTGNAAANTLDGGLGNDTLNGGTGADTMIGGDGNDTYIVDNIGDIVTEINTDSGTGGIDAVLSSINYTLGANIENLTLTGAAINGTGNTLGNVITGNASNNILDGKEGADTLRGGKGNDTYIVDNAGDVVTELFNEGVDLVKASIDYTLTDNVENLTLTDGSVNGGTVALNGTGNALNNIITGNAGSNILDGGAGVDTLKGGADNDRYIVDLIQTGTAAASFRVALQDTVTEALNAGEDTLELRGNFDHLNATTLSLGLNLENLDASATGTTKLNLTGNTLNNILTGNDAGNILDGATGSDTLIGGLGNDTYMLDLKISGTGVSANVNTFDDTVTEINGTTDGIDTIKLRGAATLTNASTLILDGQWANIENLDASATGTTKLNLTGNDADNFLTGNAAANTLDGGLGNDTLNGGTGADTMIGGDGNDTYIVDNIGDIVTEINTDSGTGGIDAVLSSINYTLGANIENLTLTGAAINGTGNTLGNVITGNASNNILDGKEGADTLIGGAGNDTMSGGADNDILIGGIGNDILSGGTGADTFVWNLADKGTNAHPSIDKITDFDSQIADGDKLDLHDLLVGESSSSGNILNYIDITTSTVAGITSTEIRISNDGHFSGGTYAAASENAHVTLVGVNLFTATGMGNEADLVNNLITNNKLIIDV